MVKKLNCEKYKERGKELKVPHYTSAAAAHNSNMPYIKATCLISRQHALNNSRLPLFLTIIEVSYRLDLLLKIKIHLVYYIAILKLVYKNYKSLVYK